MKEWRQLDSTLRNQFKRKLESLRSNLHVPSMRLSGRPNCYRIKLRKAGYRLGYEVFDDRVIIMVIAIDKRDKDQIYEVMKQRLRLPHDHD